MNQIIWKKERLDFKNAFILKLKSDFLFSYFACRSKENILSTNIDTDTGFDANRTLRDFF